MNKIEALKILIEHSFLFTEEVRQKLLLKIYEMSEPEIDALGSYLAQEKKQAIGGFEAAILTYEELIKQIEKNKTLSQN